MKTSTASMMYDHTAAHVMPVGKPLTVVQFASTLMNVILLVMMPSAITSPVKTFLARTNALALLATLVLHVLITTNVLMT